MNIRSQEEKRTVWIDLLRIFSIFLVLFTHTGTHGNKLYATTNNTTLQFIYVSFDCFRMISTPLLFMITGALLLGKQEPLKVVLSKRVARFIIILIVFSYLYVIDAHYRKGDLASFSVAQTFLNMLSTPVTGSYWFLYSYISFLLMLPLLRSIAKEMTFTRGVYLLILVEIVKDVVRVFWGMGIPQFNLSIYFVESIIFYPLMGYTIVKEWDTIVRKARSHVGLLSCILILASVLVAAVATMKHPFKLESGAWNETWITTCSPIVALAVFILFKHSLSES